MLQVDQERRDAIGHSESYQWQDGNDCVEQLHLSVYVRSFGWVKSRRKKSAYLGADFVMVWRCASPLLRKK